MFSNTATIFSTAEKLFPAFETLFWKIKKMFFLVEKTFSASQKLFSEAEAIFFESEKSFSITKKVVGTARLAARLPYDPIQVTPTLMLGPAARSCGACIRLFAASPSYDPATAPTDPRRR
jgi:hypothetical protein